MIGVWTGLMLVLAGLQMVGVGVHLNAMRRGSHRVAHGYLAVICLICLGYLLIQSQLYTHNSLVFQNHWRRVSNLVALILLMVYPRFIALCTGAERSIAPLLFLVPVLTMAYEAVVSPSGLWVYDVVSLKIVTLSWGEQIVIPVGPVNVWSYVMVGTFTAVCSYTVWRVLRSRQLVGAVGGTPLVFSNLFLLLAVFHDFFVAKGWASVPMAVLVPPVLTFGGWWRIAMLDRQRIHALRELFQYSADGILICTTDRRQVLAANAAAQNLFARVGAGIDGEGLRAVLGEGASDGRSERAPSSVSVPDAPSSVRTVYSRDLRALAGGWVLVEVALRSAQLEGETRLVATVRDLTDRRRLEREVVENERRLRLVIERSPIPIVQASRDGTVLAVNPAFTRLFGEDAISLRPGLGWEALLAGDPGRGADLATTWRRSIAMNPHGDGILDSLPAVIGADGPAPRQVEACGVIDRDRLFIFITDLTEILATQQAIQRRRAFYQAIISTAVDGIAVIDEYEASGERGGELRRTAGIWNPGMEEITGISLAAATRSGGDRPGESRLEALAKQLCGMQGTELELTVTRPDLTQRTCVVSTSQLPRAAGGRRVLVVLRDVSDAYRAEAARRAAQSQALHAQKLESIGILAGGIAHDFNNLLMSILGRASLIAVGLPDSSSLKRQALDMERSARLAADLCQQLQAYAGQGSSTLATVDLRSLTEELSRVLRVTLGSGIVFICTCEHDIGYVHGDSAQLRQLAMNLIINAADAIGERPGSIALRLGQIQARDSLPVIGGSLPPGTFLSLEVQDTGCGMDAATQAKIFEPFFTTKPKGRGLGLSAARGIVAVHGGGLQVESTPGVGTLMRVLLPAGRELRPVAALPPAVAGSGRGIVLVVDDEQEVLTTTSDLLRHLGYQVWPCRTGAGAVEALSTATDPVAGAIVDLTMPDTDGIDVVEQLRRIVPGIPVIIASGYGELEVRRRIGDAQVGSVLQKPYDLAALAQALRAWFPLTPPAGRS